MRSKGPGQSALLLLDVIDLLSQLNIPYAIIGAFAASFYGVVRASMDADAVISLHSNQTDIETLFHELKKASLKSSYRKGGFDDPIGSVVNIEDNFKNRVDLLMNIRGMKEDIFSRTVEAEFMNARICLIGVEDFIAMKIFAGSPKDLSDVVGVLKISREKIDPLFLKQRVQKYGKSALRTLHSLLRESKRGDG